MEVPGRPLRDRAADAALPERPGQDRQATEQDRRREDDPLVDEHDERDVGFGWFQTAAGGYGGTKERVIGLAVLAIGIALFPFRRIVQDGERPQWRESTPETPDQAVGAPATV
jgi:hypothetical protein